jgi:hypothetical protein
MRGTNFATPINANLFTFSVCSRHLGIDAKLLARESQRPDSSASNQEVSRQDPTSRGPDISVRVHKGSNNVFTEWKIKWNLAKLKIQITYLKHSIPSFPSAFLYSRAFSIILILERSLFFSTRATTLRPTFYWIIKCQLALLKPICQDLSLQNTIFCKMS